MGKRNKDGFYWNFRLVEECGAIFVCEGDYNRSDHTIIGITDPVTVCSTSREGVAGVCEVLEMMLNDIRYNPAVLQRDRCLDKAGIEYE